MAVRVAIKNDGVLSLQCLMVYIVNDCRKVVTCRSGNNNFSSAGIDVCLSFIHQVRYHEHDPRLHRRSDDP